MNKLMPSAQVDVQMAIATAFFYLDDNGAALRATREAAEVARALKSGREIARTLDNYGLMLAYAYDAAIESVFEPQREAVERTGSWRFSLVSHWLPALYYAWKGDLNAANASFDLQLSAIPTQSTRRTYLMTLQRHSRNLCRLIAQDYISVIKDFESHALPREMDIAYEILTDAAIAYAFLSKPSSYDDVLKQLRHLRNSLPTSYLLTNRQAVSIEIISMGAMGYWGQARRLNEESHGNDPGLAPLVATLLRFCQGPPFIGVADSLEHCLGKPYIGLCALLIRRVIFLGSTQSAKLLTVAETEVLRLIETGKSSKAIAHTRSRSVETVNRQVASIYRKLCVENRTSAVAAARERGIL